MTLQPKIECKLCPHKCAVGLGMTGICGVRTNINGELIETNAISAIAVDPIEKKPLYQFFPGKKILSIGAYGCNLRCKFCQNYQISQSVPSSAKFQYSADEIVTMAQQTSNNIGVAYTYNEPTVFYNFMLKTARLVKEAGMCNVMVSNGYINQEPLAELLKYIDAFNIDLKAFSEVFYRDVAGASLAPVLDTLLAIKNAQRHLEIAYLVIPGLNDSLDEVKLMFSWIAKNLGEETPVHINRYFPMYKMQNPPTPVNKLKEIKLLAEQQLKYCYIGNV